jgi:rhomboid protease GluP
MKRFRATAILLGVLFLFFAIELAFGAIGSDSTLLRLGAMPDSGNLQGQYWRIFTCSFLHSGYVHLLLNTSLLLWTGCIVERRVGGALMVSIYFASVLLGGVLVVLWKSAHPTLSVTVGASGGTFGLLAASLVLLYRPSAAIFGQPPLLRRVAWLIFSIGIAISFLPDVSFVAHLGGLTSGAILGLTLPILTARSDLDDSRQQPV